MSSELRLPQLAESMTAGRVSAWLKREGDWVEAGEPLLEVETEKTTVEVEAPVSGVLQRICAAAGTDQDAVGSLLAIIGGGRADTPSRQPEPPAERAAPAARTDAQAGQASGVLLPAGSPALAPGALAGDVPATPLARRMAAIAGLDLSRVPAGASGRIAKADVDRLLQRPGLAAGASPSASPQVATGTPPYDDVPLTAARRVTASRLQQAKQTVPHFYLRIECRADAILQIRRQASGAAGRGPSVTDFVVKAAASALRKVPLANSSWVEGAVRVYRSVDIAVAVRTPAGLVAPVVRSADAKSIAAISAELADFVERARAGRLSPDEYAGGTFTISNLGMYGVESLFAILNPPQSGILGVGAIEQRPVVRDGQVGIGPVMACTLSADHRAIDGATGAELLGAFKAAVEEPWLLML